MIIVIVYACLFYMCVNIYTLYLLEIGKEVEKWDEALSITQLSGVASALLFYGLSRNDLHYFKKGQCNSSSELQLNVLN